MPLAVSAKRVLLVVAEVLTEGVGAMSQGLEQKDAWRVACDCEPGDALRRSAALQRAAASYGFDWPDASGVFEKLFEEIAEIQEALHAGNAEHARHELGDLLFTVVNLARFLGADPGEELHRTNEKFRRRFESVREIIRQQGREMAECSLQELDAAWDKVKRQSSQGEIP